MDSLYWGELSCLRPAKVMLSPPRRSARRSYSVGITNVRREALTCCPIVPHSLGDVQWCSLETILRSNYLSRQENYRLWIQPYSCRLELRVPEGVSSMMIIGPHCVDLQKAGAFRLIRKSDIVAGRRSVLVHANTPFDVVPGEAVELISTNLGAIDHRHIKLARPSAWALVRRFLSEARDRGRAFLPVTRAVHKRWEMPIAPEKT
jgi:hypothetical protein